MPSTQQALSVQSQMYMLSLKSGPPAGALSHEEGKKQSWLKLGPVQPTLGLAPWLVEVKKSRAFPPGRTLTRWSGRASL